jgi:hypothetical protein
VLAACTGNGTKKAVTTTTEAPPVRDPAQRYSMETHVTSRPPDPPHFCVDTAIAVTGDDEASYYVPLDPQLRGCKAVAGLDWSQVANKHTHKGITSAELHLVGTFDGTTLTLTEPPTPARPQVLPPYLPFVDACPVPAGGFPVVDATKGGDEARSAALQYADRQMDHAGTWIGPDHETLNLTFTGDIARHRREIRAVWGAKLCVARQPRLAGDIGRVAGELHDDPAVAVAGIYVTSTHGDPIRNRAHANVFIADAAAQYWVDHKYGKGMVYLQPFLNPVP